MYIPRQSSYNIIVNTTEHTLSLYIDNELYKTYPVAVGKVNKPTPIGKFKIIQKSINPGGPFGARWMRLSAKNGHYGIHGTNNPDSIGTDISSGCVRLNNEDVIEIYDLVPIGTSVEII
jgi:lipoprotein-anchoring transpeptidase ErfK/SrfK